VPYLHYDDPDFFENWPKEFAPFQERMRDHETLRLAYFLMGDSAANAPVAVALEIAPGESIPRHAHTCHRFEIVVRGTLHADGVTLKPGDVMISEPGVLYGPNIAGPEGCTTYEIFGDYEGARSTLLPDENGEMVAYDVNDIEATREFEAKAEWGK
jgi:hypothetical protein